VEDAVHDLHAEVEGLRRLMTDLRPPVLDHSGLVNAVRDHAAALFRDTEVDVDVQGDLGGDGHDHAGGRISSDSETVLFRVAQEALLNVRRHARARTVHVEVARQTGEIVLRVVDDGVGFSPDAARERTRDGHFGLIGMRERIELAGGRWLLHSAPDRGTRVVASLPDVSPPTAPATPSAVAAEPTGAAEPAASSAER
jgi:signal transduction histidine kinase